MDWVKFTVIFLIFINRLAFGEYLKGPQNDKHSVATLYDYNIELDEAGHPLKLRCRPPKQTDDLCDDECSILKIFNQTRVNLMDRDEIKVLAETCACQLLQMQTKWEKSYDSDSLTRQVSHLVQVRTNETIQQDHSYPVYFWTDIDIVSYGISVYTSTRDYFYQLQNNPETRLKPHMKQIVSNDRNWCNIGVVCKKISQDRYFVFRYLENLARLDPSAFFRLILNDDLINTVYQASKSCKLLLLLKLNKYKLRPDDETIVVANRPDGETGDSSYNIVEDTGDSTTRDIELMIYQAKSLMPNHCNKIPDYSATDDTNPRANMYASRCPIKFDQGDTGDDIKIWLTHNATAPTIRSMAAVQCGCQLLLHNSTLHAMMKNPNVAFMAKALTNYMNNNRVPDVANTPTWVLHGWFKDIMRDLTKKRAILEIVKAKRGGEEDPTSLANKDGDSEAFNILTWGCLVINFNYNPNTHSKGRFRLAQYLEDLQSISSDPVFVFQLALQDINLFKMYALSKMCRVIEK